MAEADTTTLGTPLADGGIAAVNFFNGRLLTGKDLSREQDARRLADQRVGQAVGPGVAWGLEVTALRSSPSSQGQVRVSAGVGVTPSGQVLRLSGDTVARLVPPPSDIAATTAGGFGACEPMGPGTYVAGDGLYLLTLAPALKADGMAPVLALESVNLRCSTDAWIESVQLRLLAVNGWEGVKDLQIPPTDPDERSLAKFRNQLAHEFLASRGVAAAHARPGTAAIEGELEGWLADGPSRCDLPLALVYMVGSEILFIEAWAVRRRVASEAGSTAWAPWIGEEVQALAEARLLQFQVQLTDQGETILAKAAQDSLRWLPPAGVLPPGTSWQTFLGSRATTPLMALAPSDAPGVLAGALAGDAVNLADAGDKTRYRVYQVNGDGSFLFARDARNVHAAEQVWLDGKRAGLPDAADVQDAIDTLRAGSCLHVVLRRSMSPRQLQDTIDRAVAASAKAGDPALTLCFEPGHYDLEAPLTIAGAGSVSVHGTGARLHNRKGECALQIERCDSAEVHAIALEGGLAGSGRDALGIGLNGALTIVDTPFVSVEGVDARCAAASALGAAGIVTHMRPDGTGAIATGHVSLIGNTLKVGAGQQGLLCVNADTVRIRDNLVAGAAAGKHLQRGIVVGGQRASDVQIAGNVVRDAVRGIAVGMSDATEQGSAPLQAERVAIEGNRVELRLTDVSGGDRYGIFVGNAGSARVAGNHVKLVAGSGSTLQPHGIRLAGVYGAQVVVRDNLMVDAWRGIVFQPKPPRPAYFVWAFQYNVSLGGAAIVLALPYDLTTNGPAATRAWLDQNQPNLELVGGGAAPAPVPAPSPSPSPAPAPAPTPTSSVALPRRMSIKQTVPYTGATVEQPDKGKFIQLANTLSHFATDGDATTLSFGPFSFAGPSKSGSMALELRFVVDGVAAPEKRFDADRSQLTLTAPKTPRATHVVWVEARTVLLSGTPEDSATISGKVAFSAT